MGSLHIARYEAEGIQFESRADLGHTEIRVFVVSLIPQENTLHWDINTSCVTHAG
jgi:hypothetical protein